MMPRYCSPLTPALLLGLSLTAWSAPALEKHNHPALTPAVTTPTRSADAPPPPGYEKVDLRLTISTLPGKMKYDAELVKVHPGAKIKLTLKNNDEMQHNLLICRPGEGVTLEVAQAAWALGSEALSRNFIPDSPLILHHTGVVNPHQSDTVYFTAPTREEDYPYVCTLPGHAFTMKGILRVGGGSPVPLTKVKPKGEADPEHYYIHVTDRPQVVRCAMPDSSPRSIAVGLPGGINYCFDAEACCVRYGWKGDFLDTGPDRGRDGTRGGAPNRPLGATFSLPSGFPPHIGEGDAPPMVKFQGYHLAPVPAFFYSINGIRVIQTVERNDFLGIDYTFEFLDPLPGPVRFFGKGLTSSAGTVHDGVLTIPADKARKFGIPLGTQ